MEENQTITLTLTLTMNQKTDKEIILLCLAYLLIFLVFNLAAPFLFNRGRSAIRHMKFAQIPLLVYDGHDDNVVRSGDVRCPICFEDYVEGDKIRVLPKCNHFFHGSCLDPWLLTSASWLCPICRRFIMKGSLAPNTLPELLYILVLHFSFLFMMYSLNNYVDSRSC